MKDNEGRNYITEKRMRKLALAVSGTLAVLTTFAAPAAAAGCSSASRQRAEAEIVRIENEMAGAQGVAGVTRTWSPDMVWFEIGPVEIHGGQAATALTTEQFKALGPLRSRIVRMQVKADCNIGYAFLALHFVADTADGKATINFMMRETDIFERRAGTWKVVHQHLSVPVDLATGRAVLSDRDLLDYPLSVAPGK